MNSLLFLAAHAATSTVAAPAAVQATGDLTDIIHQAYNAAMMFGGLLAFLMILYAGAKYVFEPGSSSAQGDAKDQIWQAFLGLLLLFGIYIILNTINPDLTRLRVPTLQKVQVPAEVPAGTLGSASGGANTNSRGVQQILSCVSGIVSVPATTYQGTHRINSCHFGGKTCTDGSHAIDWGENGLRAAGKTMQEMIGIAEQCGSATGVPIACRCETPEGEIVACGAPEANHVHCNVDNRSCGCN